MKQVKENTLEWWKLLVLGPPGAGKSYAPTSYPGKHLFIQTEPGINTALTKRDYKSRVTLVQVDSWDDIDALRNGIDAWINYSNKKMKNNKDWEPIEGPFSLVILDSVTWLQAIIMAQSLVDYPGGKSTSEGVPSMINYRITSERTFQVIRALLKSPYNIYMTCQASMRPIDPTNEDSPMVMMPSLSGFMRNKITYDVDWVLWAEGNYDKKLKKTIYTVTDQPSKHIAVKSRSEVPVGEMEFNLEKIVDRLKGATLDAQ